MKNTLLLLAMLVSMALHGQNVLKSYIDQAITNSEALKQQNITLERANLALKEARLLFRPTSTLTTDYFLAAGGRTVDFPIGDILNPVYSTLNQLTQSNQFPQLENQRILLNPNNFYDLKVRTAMPLVNAEIKVAQRIKEQQIGLENTEKARYTHELTHDVKAAYYQYLKAAEAVRIYQAAVALAQESVRVNQSLFRNDKVNRTSVIRAEQEVVKYTSQSEVAQQTTANAQAYLNFLINRPLTERIDTVSLADTPDAIVLQLTQSTIGNRKELAKLEQAQQVSKQLVTLAQASQRSSGISLRLAEMTSRCSRPI
jgi:outer membrane protein TolC